MRPCHCSRATPQAAGSRADDEGKPLLDAATGEEVARISATGLDLGAMTDHARDVGGPAIRALTFHERAGLLKAVAKHLTAGQGRALRAVAPHRRHPARLDGRHRRRHRHRVQLSPARAPASCPTTRSSSTARLERLGREGTLRRPARLHLAARCRGADQRVQLPGLGHAREARARVPRRPADDREAGQPDGVPHRAGRPPDHRVRAAARGRRCSCSAAARPACSTSSARRTRSRSPAPRTPARILRQHPSVLHGGVRLGVEADSLNCSILGPDVTVDDPEFDLFVKGVVTEMTVKAGQKCTAIRRVIVPGRDRRRGRPRRSPRGWRRSPSATPPTTTCGWARSRASASATRCARRCRRCAAPPRSCTATRTTSTSSTPTPSAVRSCRRCCCGRAEGAREPHDVEPFGPVSTVIAYDGLDEAVALAARGSGSLVGSLVTHDPDGRPHGDARARALARPDPGARPRRRRGSPPATARRCRCSCTAAPAGPAVARSSAASAACCTTCSAPRSRPRPTC